MECKIYLEMTVGRNDNECIFCLQTVGFLASFEVNREWNFLLVYVEARLASRRLITHKSVACFSKNDMKIRFISATQLYLVRHLDRYDCISWAQ